MPKLITSRTRIEDLKKPRIIVVGGGFGGLELIKSLKGINGQVVLFDRYNHHTFQPLLYQVATSAINTNSIVFPFRKKFRSYKDFYFRLADVIKVNPEENQIETSIGTVKYDYLVLATGATTNYFGQEGFEKNAVALKTIEDAIKLRNRVIKNFENALLAEDPSEMNSYMDYVIVGGGPTGVEVAGALAELKRHVLPSDYRELDFKEMDIHLVEATGRVLNGMSGTSSEKALKFLKKMGVKVHLNTKVISYDGDGVTFDRMDPIRSKTVLWAAGVKGNPIEGLYPQSYHKSGRLNVNAFNQVEGHSNIFAIGDLALMSSEEFPHGHPMMAPAAIQQGNLLASNLKKLLRKKEIKPFRFVNKGSMATIGRNRAVVELGKLKWQGMFAWYIWLFVHLMALVGFRNRVGVFFQWLISYFTYDKSNRLIIGDKRDA
jgi:NADH:ubiquinone reductase (H+-translocating)